MLTKLLGNIHEYLGSKVDFEEADSLTSLDFAFFNFVIPEFAVASKPKKCTPGKGFACGNSCIAIKTKSGKDMQCRKPLTGQAKTYAEFLKQQGGAKNKPLKEQNKASVNPQGGISGGHDYIPKAIFSHGADYNLDKVYVSKSGSYDDEEFKKIQSSGGGYIYRYIPRNAHQLGTESPQWDADFSRKKYISKEEYEKKLPEFQKAENSKGQILNQNARMKALSAVTGFSAKEIKPLIKSLEEFSGREFESIRRADRGQERDSDGKKIPEKFKKHAENVNKLLNVLPSYEGKIYRGVPETTSDGTKFLDMLTSDKGYKTSSMSSFTSDPEVADRFAIGRNSIVMVVTNNKSGKSVRNLSIEPQEDEVLSPKNVTYKAKSPPKITTKNGTVYVEVEEVADVNFLEKAPEQVEGFGTQKSGLFQEEWRKDRFIETDI